MLAVAEKQIKNWVGWNYALSVLLEEIVAPFPFNGSAQARLIYLWRMYGFIGGWRLLAETELPEKGKEGFRIRHCYSKQYVDVIRRTDGIYVRSTITDSNCVFEASTTKPSEHMIEQFEACLDYLLAHGDFGTNF